MKRRSKNREIEEVDPTLVSEIRKYGKFDISACYNCGSCVIICPTSNSAPFPRQAMRYAQIGLRKSLLSSLDPWLCYYCGDCSKTCPRQTEPGESMMTLRRYLSSNYDWTGISSKIYRSTTQKIFSLLLSMVFFFFLFIFYHLYYVKMPLSDFTTTPMGLEHMFPKILYFTLAVFLIPLFFLISNAFRMFWFTIKDDKIPLSLYLTELKTFIIHALTQIQFRKCDGSQRGRWIKHFLLVSGYLAMFIILVFFLRWFQTDNLYPIYHPQRWLGYYAFCVLTFFSVEAIVGRIKKQEQIHRFSESGDLILPTLLLLTSLSGIAVHILRYFKFEMATHYLYALHLAIAFPMLVMEVPFGKLSHALYRPLAMYFQTIKEKSLKQQAELKLEEVKMA